MPRKKKRRLNEPRYRNLIKRGGQWYFQKIENGKRIRFSLHTSDREAAAAYVAEKFAERPALMNAPPTFAEAAQRYLEWLRSAGRKDSVIYDREKLLEEGGRLTVYFGRWRLDEIDARTIDEWWTREVAGRGLKRNTGRNYLTALSQVFALAVRNQWIQENPAEGFRKVFLPVTRNTAQARAEYDTARTIHPIPLECLGPMLEKAREIGGGAYRVTLLMLDAGLRIGEACALKWEDVDLDERMLNVCRSRSRCGGETTTKSGRARRVEISSRLLRALKAWHLADGRRSSGLVARSRNGTPVHASNYTNRIWKRLLAAADLPIERAPGVRPFTPHDSRDTYASYLLTHGIQLAYISKQLGHASVEVTAQRYARCAGGDRYVAPTQLRPGEVPADLLARVAEEESQRRKA